MVTLSQFKIKEGGNAFKKTKHLEREKRDRAQNTQGKVGKNGTLPRIRARGGRWGYGFGK